MYDLFVNVIILLYTTESVVLYRYYLYIRKGDTQMDEIQSTTIPSVGKTIIDEYIESLIQNTADGTQFWHTDMSGKCLRYYYNTGQEGVRICIMQDWITPEAVMFSLRMAYGENYDCESLIASEHTPHEEPCRLRELWLVAQQALSDEENDNFDLMTYARLYTSEVKQKNLFDDLCRVLVTASEDILEVFKEKETQ